jgi:hypothetical protein
MRWPKNTKPSSLALCSRSRISIARAASGTRCSRPYLFWHQKSIGNVPERFSGSTGRAQGLTRFERVKALPPGTRPHEGPALAAFVVDLETEAATIGMTPRLFDLATIRTVSRLSLFILGT